MARLVAGEVKTTLEETVASFPHDACLTCECFLGLVVQLRLDADVPGKELANQYQVERHSVHTCLGCDPCPPGDRYAAYMREKRKAALIQL